MVETPPRRRRIRESFEASRGIISPPASGRHARLARTPGWSGNAVLAPRWCPDARARNVPRLDAQLRPEAVAASARASAPPGDPIPPRRTRRTGGGLPCPDDAAARRLIELSPDLRVLRALGGAPLFLVASTPRSASARRLIVHVLPGPQVSRPARPPRSPGRIRAQSAHARPRRGLNARIRAIRGSTERDPRSWEMAPWPGLRASRERVGSLGLAVPGGLRSPSAPSGEWLVCARGKDGAEEDQGGANRPARCWSRAGFTGPEHLAGDRRRHDANGRR